MKKQSDIFLGGGTNLTVQSAQLVSLKEVLVVFNGSTDPIELEVKVEADLSTVPDKYHEVFLNVLTAKYYGKVSFGDNPFSQCLPPKKKKWWQFWKAKQ